MNFTTITDALLQNSKDTSRRLIDTGLLYHEASSAGNLERYRRGETSHTIHVWWARRPHIAMRSLIYATICKKFSAKDIKIMDKLSIEYKNLHYIEQARQSISRGYTKRPKVLDMFGGGGTIPYEALNLGLDSYSIDSNELSVFIQKANLQYLYDAEINNLTEMLEASGNRVIANLKRITNDIFPERNRKDGKQTTNYLWTYSYPCQKCGKEFLLSKRYWLSRKKQRKLYLKLHEQVKGSRFSIKRGDVIPEQTNWLKRSNTVQCPHCNYQMSGISIKSATDIPVIEVVKETPGKSFHIAQQLSEKLRMKIEKKGERMLRDLEEDLPKSLLPKWSGIVNPALYGIEAHADIFNPRQRTVCLSLLKSLKDEYIYMSQKVGQSTAKYIISVLSGLVDQAVDWNCRITSWISQNEQVGRAFCGPGIPMYWDYNETDPVADGPANLKAKLKRIIEGVKSIKKLPNRGYVEHGIAQSLPFPDKMFDGIVTDPPYYDNIFYTVLADNFYVWKKMLLKHIEPELFKNKTTHSDDELVASSKRNGSCEKAHKYYCINLKKVINEASRVLKDDGVMSFIYSHSSVLGWEALIKSFRCSPMIFTGIQPLSIERKQRPRAVNSKAVNTCIAFVAKKMKGSKSPLTLDQLLDDFKRILISDLIPLLTRKGWCEGDIAISLMAHGVALISNAEYIENAGDRTALLTLERLVKDIFPEFKLNKRESL